MYRFSVLRKNNSKYLVKKVIIAADHAGVILKKKYFTIFTEKRIYSERRRNK